MVYQALSEIIISKDFKVFFMNKTYLLITSFLLVFITELNAQQSGVAINTDGSAPDANAMLDVKSTNKGFLLPRMTQFQRLALTPVNGLLVYETSTNRLYQYQDGAWQYFINNSFWTKSATRDRLYNGNDSIGIGTSTPDEKLHVVGKIKVSDRIDAGGIVSAAGLSTSGALFVNGTSFTQGSSIFQGNITGNSDAEIGGLVTSNTGMVINDAAGTLTYKNAGVDKGFVQLSGDDLRLGTYSSNTDGRFIVRVGGSNRMTVYPNGNVGIGTTSEPAAKLHVEGIAAFGEVVTQEVTNPTTGSTNNLIPLCYGNVNDAGSLIRGTNNVSVTKESSSEVSYGRYFLIHCPGITATSIIVATINYAFYAIETGSFFIGAVYDSPGKAKVRILSNTSNGTGSYYGAFSFIIYK